MSGLSRTPGKRVWANPHRGFESRPLRQMHSPSSSRYLGFFAWRGQHGPSGVAPRVFLQARDDARAAAKLLTTLDAGLAAKLPDPVARFFYEATIRYGQKSVQAQEEWSMEMMQALEGLSKSPEPINSPKSEKQ